MKAQGPMWASNLSGRALVRKPQVRNTSMRSMKRAPMRSQKPARGKAELTVSGEGPGMRCAAMPAEEVGGSGVGEKLGADGRMGGADTEGAAETPSGAVGRV